MPADTVARLCGESGILADKREKFQELLGLSIDRALDIMKIVPTVEMKDVHKLISTQSSIMSSVFSTASRVDENALRQQQDDKLSEILEEIRRRDRLSVN